MTDRINVTKSVPTTAFALEADLISQNLEGNYSVIHIYLRATNQGNSSSYSNWPGSQLWSIDGINAGTGHINTPFLPSGYANGQLRWRDGPWIVNIPHDVNGNRDAITLRMVLNYDNGGVNNENYTASWGPFPRIPKRPSEPGTPTFSETTPTSARISWTASADNRGTPIDAYLVRRWYNENGTGQYVDWLGNVLTKVDTGLEPGHKYLYRIYAHNGSADNGGFSNASGGAILGTVAGFRIRVGGVYKVAVPYVRVGGVYKLATPYVRVSGIYKLTG